MATFPWRITGTDQQQTITREAIEAIKFPFEVLIFTRQPELGWRDLNGGYYSEGSGSHDEHSHEEDKAEPLFGKVNGRKYTLGVYYPGSANIYIDNKLVGQYAHYALSTISAEIAHAVDESILSDGQRETFISLLCQNHGAHTWWEKIDYGAEYDDLIGETFMILFTKGYSDIPFSNAESFTHSGHNLTGEDVRAIVGIERTDKPAPAPAPEPEPTPAPAPEPHNHHVKYGNSNVYHRPTHKVRSKHQPTKLHDLTGLRPCKVCRPE